MAIGITKINTATLLSGGSTTLAFSGAVTAGSTLVAGGFSYNGSGTPASPAISDSVNGAWTVQRYASVTADTNIECWIATKENTAAGTPTVTWNPNGASADMGGWFIAEITGASTPTSVDVAVTNQQNVSMDVPSVASGTLAQASEILIAVMTGRTSNATVTIAADGTYTQLVNQGDNGASQMGHAQYKIVSSTASDTADWTVTDGNTNPTFKQKLSLLISIKEAAGPVSGSLASTLGAATVAGTATGGSAGPTNGSLAVTLDAATVAATGTNGSTSGGPITLVSGAFLSEKLASGATTAAINTTGANLIVTGTTFNTFPGITDSKSNTYTQACSTDYFGAQFLRGHYVSGPVVGSGHTFTFTSASGGISLAAFSGVKATSPLDQTSAAMTNFSTTSQAGSITPTENNELIVAICYWSGANAGDSITSISDGFTLISQFPSTATGEERSTAIAYKVQTTAAAVNPTWTKSGGGPTYFPSALMSFKAEPGGGGISSGAGASAGSASASAVAVASATAALSGTAVGGITETNLVSGGRTIVITLTNDTFVGSTGFFDDFLGSSIDSSKWTVYDRISDQVNGEVNCVVPANISIASSILSGVSKFEDHSCGDTLQAPVTEHYTSWQIAQATAPFLYGTVEVRAKMPGGTGLWPCIWMLGYEWQASQPYTANTPGHNWPVGGWCEVDIAEFMSNARSQVNCVIHFGTAGGSSLQNLPYDATTRFMVYRLQWSAGSMIWSVDAEDGIGWRTLRTVSGGGVPNVAMYLIIHCAIGGIGGGTPSSGTFPQTMFVDWARITQ